MRHRHTCPTTTREAQAHHERVKADAATGAPQTAHGRRLLETRRDWPGLDGCWCGECLCRSTLLVGFVDADDATA